MKKHCSYRPTPTGVRIPKRKIKWMVPTKDSAPNDLDTILPESEQFNNLYLRNFNFFMQGKAFSEADEVIEIADWQEGGQNGY